MSKLVISVLGTPTVDVDGAPVQVDTRKATALLVYLAMTGRTQSRDRLSGLLWPDYDQDRARAALRRTLSALRKALGERWVSADRLGVSLDLDGVEVDARTFRRRLEEAASHGHPAGEACSGCVRALAAAVDAFAGTFLHGFALRDAEPFEEWQSLEAESLERQLAGALEKLIRARVSEGELEPAVEVAQRKLALDPLDEPAHRQLMQLYAWRGMRTAALQQYRECVAVLDRELGVSPLAETTDLYEAIAEGAVEAVERTQLVQPAAVEPATSGPETYALRGREREWELLHEAYAASGPSGTLVAVEGEAGIGKTRLARDLLGSLSERGVRTATARCYEGEAGLPYALITQLLGQLEDRLATAPIDPRAGSEAARLLPSLVRDHQPVGSIDDPGALSRFFEGLRRVLVALAEERLGAIFLDDLHWCDRASLEVLGYIARRLDETPLCIVVAWRSEEVEPDHPLRKIAAEATRLQPARHIVLGRLSEADVKALVQDSAAVEPTGTEALAARLMDESEGIPFFVVEYLAVLGTAAASAWDMPPTIKELLRSRAGLVGQTARQVLGAAAVIDRSFDFDTVWRAGGRTELETVDALEELVHHGLVLPSSAGSGATYEFSHEKLRAFVYDSMSPARRRVLHRRVAEAFVAVSRRPEQLASTAALVARHYELGGMELEAARYYEVAAARARDIFANREALAHYLSALALGHPDPAALHEGAGDMYVLLGEYKNAVDSFEKAAALAAPEAIPVLEHKLGEVHLRRGDFDLSQSHFITALETLGPGDAVAEARLLAAMSFNAHRKGQLEEAAALALRALEAATVCGDAPALARAHNQLGILENAHARYTEAKVHLGKSLALAEELGDVAGRAAALNNLALAARSENDLTGALKLTREALEMCVQQGDRHREAALRNNLADLLHQRGETEAAMGQLKRATATLAEIGEEPTGLLPEVWKLVEW